MGGEINKYWEIEKNEVIAFYNSLTYEKLTFRLPIENILKSEVIIAEHTDGNIAGIAGIRRHKMFPVVFIAVKFTFQKKGIGNILIKRLHYITRYKYMLLVLSVLKENSNAVVFFKKLGYDLLFERNGVIYMIFTTNSIGKIIIKLLKSLIPTNFYSS